MAENDVSEQSESAKQRNGTSQQPTSVVERVGVLSQILSDELALLRGQIRTGKQGGGSELTTYQKKQLFWTRLSSILSLALCALALAVLYLILTVSERQREITGRQLTVMQSQLEEMKNAARQTDRLITAATNQAIASKESAGAAKQTIEVARDNTRLDQRAWLGATSARVIDLAVNKPLKVEIQLKNTGKTVARNVDARITIRSESGPFNLKNFRAERPPPKGNRSRFVILPDSELTLPAYGDRLLTQETLSLIKGSGVTIYLFGEIIYADIFGETHVTAFCNFYDPSTNDLVFCSEGNSAT
jgi:hypothetical protein